jgi:hypothetical protein
MVCDRMISRRGVEADKESSQFVAERFIALVRPHKRFPQRDKSLRYELGETSLFSLEVGWCIRHHRCQIFIDMIGRDR